MQKIKVVSVIVGNYGFDTIVTENLQIAVPKTAKAESYIGKTVNIEFGEKVVITEVKNTKE